MKKLKIVALIVISFFVICAFSVVSAAENTDSIANERIIAPREVIDVDTEKRTGIQQAPRPSGPSNIQQAPRPSGPWNDLPRKAPHLGGLKAGTFCCTNATSTGGTGCHETNSASFCTNFKIDCRGNTTLGADGNLTCW